VRTVLVAYLAIALVWAWSVGWDLTFSEQSPLRRRSSRPGDGHAAAFFVHVVLVTCVAILAAVVVTALG
jgi:hypothetical protein